MYDELMILSALRYKSLWKKYQSSIKPGHLSSPSSKQLLSKISSLHQKGQSKILPTDIFHTEMPRITNLTTARLILADFAARCKLNDAAININKKLNTSSLLSPADLEDIQIDIPPQNEEDDVVLYSQDKPKAERYPTGFRALTDALQGGLSPGELCLISAPPFGGKTHWLISLGAYYAMCGHTVLHFVLEDLVGDIAKYYNIAIQRYIAKQCKAERIKHRRIKLDSSLRSSQAKYSILSLVPNLALYDTSSAIFSTEKLDSVLPKHIQLNSKGEVPPVVIVDYLDIMHDRSENEVTRLRNISRDLRRLGNKYNAIMLSATQSDAESWDKKYPTMRNLADSKVGKASMADIILMFSQLAHEKPAGDGRLVIAKARGRGIKKSVIPVRVDWSNFKIRRKK